MKPDAFALPVLSDRAPSPSESHPKPKESPYSRTYWRSLEEKVLGKAALPDADREFPTAVLSPPTGLARREFIQLAAASAALAGLSACTEKPVERILPYTKTPDGLAPGNPLHYATAYSFQGYGNGLLATSWEGRPTKIEGNPQHPTSLGATSMFEQALTIQLYDPMRARLIKHHGSGKSWRSLREVLVAQGAAWEQDGGAKLRFLMEPSSSPFEGSLRQQILARFPKAKFYSASSVNLDNEYEAARLAFGQPLEKHYNLADADVVFSLEDDFLEARPDHLKDARAFASRRDLKHAHGMNRLYVAESRVSVTGSVADHRLRVRSCDVEGLALALASALAGQVGGLGDFAGLGQRVRLTSDQQRFINAAARDLAQKRGRSLVAVGDRQSPRTHAVAHAMNAALGNLGQTVRFNRPLLHDVFTGPAAWRALVDEMNSGAVDALFIDAWNPVYAAPADVDFGAALDKLSKRAQSSDLVGSIYLSLHEDETASHADWFVPKAHMLEAWGDTRAKDGTLSIIQPLIQPLFNGLSTPDLLAAFLNIPESRVHDQLKSFHASQQGGADFESTWEVWLSEGLVPHTAEPAVTPKLDLAAVAQAAASARPAPADALELSFVPDYKLFDGRYANATWLQEIPDPLSKVSWDNAALMSPTTAAQLGVKENDLVRIKKGTGQVEVPVFVLPGHADQSVTLALGYGRQGAEQVAVGAGVNANLLRTSDALWFTTGVEVSRLDAVRELSTTQKHWSTEGRPIALMQTAKEFKEHPEAAEQRGPLQTLFRPFDYTQENYRWAMSVDMSRCTGCTACMIACQAENNIPVVGREEVAHGRAMHWIRVDRYFTGSDTDPEVVSEPMLCQQCESAPCEYVCPVAATVHSDEGLNDMVYNRCIGTRYCSNNCPYKVRRFNYLHWNADMSPLQRMAMNPDVTVRDRGVMEKCTYCVQRIERTRIVARIEGRAIRETELKTACQQVCPTEALVFGNLADPNSRVSKLHADERRFDVLHELNTRPRTAYLTRIKNPNPELA